MVYLLKIKFKQKMNKLIKLFVIALLLGGTFEADAQFFRKKTMTVTLPYTMVDSLPASIPYGHQVLYNGTMWRGLVEGESTLPAGTPWPVKGYLSIQTNILGNISGIVSTDIPVISINDTTTANSITYILDLDSLPITSLNTYKVLAIFSTGRIDGPGTASLIRAVNKGSNTIRIQLNDNSGNIITTSLLNANNDGEIRIYPPPPTP
jgi:hypothetical protein